MFTQLLEGAFEEELPAQLPPEKTLREIHAKLEQRPAESRRSPAEDSAQTVARAESEIAKKNHDASAPGQNSRIEQAEAHGRSQHADSVNSTHL